MGWLATSAHQQPRAGAGIAEIEHVLRARRGRRRPTPVDAPAALAVARDARRPARASPRRCAARPRLRAARARACGRWRARPGSARDAISTCRPARDQPAVQRRGGSRGKRRHRCLVMCAASSSTSGRRHKWPGIRPWHRGQSMILLLTAVARSWQLAGHRATNGGG